MASPPTIEPFKGSNWEECNSFIRAIRAAAWKEGKSRDTAWIADFAGLHFSHKALTWHSRLPQDVRRDWEKLEVALLERWTPPEGDDGPRIEPTPAAAPLLNRSDRTDCPLQGALKLVINGSNMNYYSKLGEDGYCLVTNNPNEALRIRCSSLSNTTVLERIDGSHHSWLAVKWRKTNPNLEKGSTEWGFLVFVDSLTLKTSCLSPADSNSLYQLASCTLSTDGEVIPFWKNSDTSKIAIGVFRDVNDLCVAADPDAYSKRRPHESKVKMFIEPID